MWLRVELLATDGWVEVGDVPAEAAEACRRRAPVVDDVFVAAVDEREKVTDHDVAAFVDVVQEAIGQPEGSWIHYGLTSSDVVDTALVRHADPGFGPAHRGRLGPGGGAEGAGRRSPSTSR